MVSIEVLLRSVPSLIDVYATSLYFSAATFVTLVYGDIQPATTATQLLAAGEAVAGAFLMALFIFVLGRPATQ